MSGMTEGVVWRWLARAIDEVVQEQQLSRAILHATRVETGGTRAGVSDVEYVATPFHGWIELKCATIRRNGTIRLHTPFTMDQCGWLIGHHDPAHHLRSWLCIVYPDPDPRFLFLPPRLTPPLIHDAYPTPPLLRSLTTRNEARLYDDARDAIRALRDADGTVQAPRTGQRRAMGTGARGTSPGAARGGRRRPT